MKRKVIQLAGKTAVVSLPSKWVKKYSVKKSDEIEIEERGNELIIKTESQNKHRAIALDINDFSDKTLRYCISGLHKAGYDEIILNYSKPQFNESINDLVANLMLGFVVSEHTDKKIVLRNIASEDRSEFNSSLRRCFLVALNLADSSLEMLKSSDFSILSSLSSLEKSTNQLSSFCLRLINKGVNIKNEDSIFTSIVVWSLEKIADEYKNIFELVARNKVKVNVEILSLYSKINILLRAYYNFYYNFDPRVLNELNDNKIEIIKEANKIKTFSREEIQIINYLMTVVSKVFDLNSSIFALNHEKLSVKFIY